MLLSTAAYAQSAITGVAKDTTGATMPGVTVEASSDVLIEKVKSAITDENGNYRIGDLRPGTYSVSFTLTGFKTFMRDGLQLPAEFTATINAKLAVGSLEETITVTGSSPVVDVTTAAKTSVLNREAIDAIPPAAASRAWPSSSSASTSACPTPAAPARCSRPTCQPTA